MLSLAVVGFTLVALWLMRRAARRFAERQRRLGRWDAEGPLVETARPTGNWGMNERLEIVGKQRASILRDRRRDARADDAGDSFLGRE